MKKADISIMVEGDVGFAVEMTSAENWGNVAADFHRLIALEPEGCFVARQGGDRVGMITTTTYGQFAFIGSLIVRPLCRGKGIGGLLLQTALDYLEGKGVTAQELDATFRAVPLYRRYGFQDKYLSLRFQGVAPAMERTPRRGAVLDRNGTFDLDRRLTGLQRSHVIGRLLAEGASLVTMNDGRSQGFAIVREQRSGILSCGPVIAEQVGVAEKLLCSLFSRCTGSRIGFGVPEGNRHMVNLLLQYGFSYLEPSLRMYRGSHVCYEDGVYGIISPEKG